jgi:hypothetical protein
VAAAAVAVGVGAGGWGVGRCVVVMKMLTREEAIAAAKRALKWPAGKGDFWYAGEGFG